MNITLTDFIIFVALILVYLVLKNLLSNYFSQKGRNLAQQEDIQILTRKIEEAKEQFIERTEKLKSQLSLISRLQFEHKSEERNAFLRFHEAMFTWINGCLDFGHGGIDDYNNDSIDQRIFFLNEAHQKVNDALSILELYLVDIELLDSINSLKLAILENLSFAPIQCLRTLQKLNLEKKELNSIPTIEERELKLQEFFNNRKKIHSDFRIIIFNGYKSVTNEIKNYQKNSRKYLKRISEE